MNAVLSAKPNPIQGTPRSHTRIRTGHLEPWFLIGAPTLLLLYGLTRFIDGSDGDYGPGAAWVVGHVFFLLSIVSFGGVMLGLRARLLDAGVGRGAAATATTAVVAGLAGTLAFVRVIVVDILVGLRAPNHGSMSELADRYDRQPVAIPEAVQLVGPMLFMGGLILLLIQLTLVKAHRLPWWSPVVTLAGFVPIQLTLQTLPISAVCFGIALAPLVRAWDRPR